MSSLPSRQSTQHALDEDAEKNFQPRSPKFWMIIIGIYLSIFLVALVGLLGKEWQRRAHSHDLDRID